MAEQDNNHQANSGSTEDQLLARLALLAEQHTPTDPPLGDRPSPEELALFYDNQLDFNRKQQVIAHLNADPTLRQQWLGLVDIMSDSKHTAETHSSLRDTVPCFWEKTELPTLSRKTSTLM